MAECAKTVGHVLVDFTRRENHCPISYLAWPCTIGIVDNVF